MSSIIVFFHRVNGYELVDDVCDGRRSSDLVMAKRHSLTQSRASPIMSRATSFLHNSYSSAF